MVAAHGQGVNARPARAAQRWGIIVVTQLGEGAGGTDRALGAPEGSLVALTRGLISASYWLALDNAEDGKGLDD